MPNVELKNKKGIPIEYSNVDNVVVPDPNGDPVSYSRLPEVDGSDNGKVLGVIEGQWNKMNIGPGISYQVVNELPQTGEVGVIYLVPIEGSTNDVYDEYLWVNNAFEKIGTTEIHDNAVCFTFDVAHDEYTGSYATNFSLSGQEILDALSEGKFVYGMSSGNLNCQWINSYYVANVQQATFTTINNVYSSDFYIDQNTTTSSQVTVYETTLQGEPGQDGTDGQDGISPTITLTPVSDGVQIEVYNDDSGMPSYSEIVYNGQDGQDGAEGPPGQGVPAGGSEGQILKKASDTNYATEWTGDYVRSISVIDGDLAITYGDGTFTTVDIGSFALINDFSTIISGWDTLFSTLFTAASASIGTTVGVSGCEPSSILSLWLAIVDTVFSAEKLPSVLVYVNETYQIVTSFTAYDFYVDGTIAPDGPVLEDLPRSIAYTNIKLRGMYFDNNSSTLYNMELVINYIGEFYLTCTASTGFQALPNQAPSTADVADDMSYGINDISYSDLHSYYESQESFTITGQEDSYNAQFTNTSAILVSYQGVLYHIDIQFDDDVATFSILGITYSLD